MGGEAGARQKKRRKRKQQEKKGAQRRANAPPPPAPAASPSDVAAWVLEVLPAGAALNAEPAAERLVSEAVDGATLRELDAADLRDIGFSRVQAKKLLAALRREQDETRDAGDPADSSHSDGGGSVSQVPLHAIPVATAPPQLVVPPTYDHEDSASAEHDEAEWYAIPMQRWGEREALAWVSTLGPRSGGGQNVRAAFARENIDGPLLVALGQDDADDLGLSFREAKVSKAALRVRACPTPYTPKVNLSWEAFANPSRARRFLPRLSAPHGIAFAHEARRVDRSRLRPSRQATAGAPEAVHAENRQKESTHGAHREDVHSIVHTRGRLASLERGLPDGIQADSLLKKAQ